MKINIRALTLILAFSFLSGCVLLLHINIFVMENNETYTKINDEWFLDISLESNKTGDLVFVTGEDTKFRLKISLFHSNEISELFISNYVSISNIEIIIDSVPLVMEEQYSEIIRRLGKSTPEVNEMFGLTKHSQVRYYYKPFQIPTNTDDIILSFDFNLGNETKKCVYNLYRNKYIKPHMIGSKTII